ncbi:MAG: PAS domain S-box protein [Planctomycetota bacterium]|nr:MAG: PAS domain S-box protein [Planctomycetota bacterium]
MKLRKHRAPAAFRPLRNGHDALPSVFAVDAASDGIIGIDKEGVIRSWNPAARRIFGYARAEIVGRPLATLVSPKLRKEIGGFLARTRANPWVRYGEAGCLRKGSEPIVVGFTVLPEQSLVPDRTGLALIVHDITERKKAEEELRRSIDRLGGAERLAHLGSWEWDVATQTLTWSRELNELLGVKGSPRRSSIDRFLRRFRPEDREPMRARIEKTLKDRTPFECRVALRRVDGTPVSVFASAMVVENPDRTLRLVGILQDTGKLRAVMARPMELVREQAQSATVQQIRALFLARAAALLFSTFDYESAVLRAIKAAVPVLADRCVVDLRSDDGSVLRLSSAALLSARKKDEPGWVRREKRSSLPGGAPGRVWASGEFELCSKVDAGSLPEILPDPRAYSLRPGTVPCSVLVVPLRTRRELLGVMTLIHAESGREFQAPDVVIAQKLTYLMALAIDHGRLHADVVRQADELRKKEMDLAALNRELEDRVSQRTAQLREAVRSLDTFGRTVAHDLRAPLRAITGFADALDEDFGGEALPPEGRQFVSRIREGCRRMDTFIRDLLTYSQAGQSEISFVPLDLGKIVADAQTRVEADLQTRKARVVVEPGLPRVLGSESLLVQAVANLLSTAVKFVAPGVQPSIRVAAERQNGRVRLWIEDNGIGIDPQDTQRIFEAFERLHSVDAYPGTGLGLAIVRRAVERMGGRIGVESQVGRGSRFWTDLPPAPE